MNKNEMYRMIPKTDILLKEKEIQELADKYGRQAVVGILQEILQEPVSYTHLTLPTILLV